MYSKRVLIRLLFFCPLFTETIEKYSLTIILGRVFSVMLQSYHNVDLTNHDAYEVRYTVNCREIQT